MFIISLEGLDGSGKSYLAKKVRRALESAGYQVTYLHEGSEFGGQLTPFISTNDPWTRDLLYGAATISTVRCLQAEKPDVVLIDRYIDSLMVYASDDRRLLTKVVRNLLEELSKTVPQPDVTLFLDTTFDEIETRRKARGEHINWGFERKIYEKFQERIQQDPLRFYVIKSGTPLEEVMQYILRRIEKSSPLESSMEDL